MNDDADKFLRDLQRPEDPVERAGRHHAESMVRYATERAVSSLAEAVATIARAQTENATKLGDLQEASAEMNKAITRMVTMLEGSLTEDGTRTLGIVDHVAVFRRWKGGVTALLWATATGAIGTLGVGVIRLYIDVVALHAVGR